MFRVCLQRRVYPLDGAIRITHRKVSIYQLCEPKDRLRLPLQGFFIGYQGLGIFFLGLVEAALAEGAQPCLWRCLFKLCQHDLQLFGIPLLGKNLCLGTKHFSISRFSLQGCIHLLQRTIQIAASRQHLRQA